MFKLATLFLSFHVNSFIKGQLHKISLRKIYLYKTGNFITETNGVYIKFISKLGVAMIYIYIDIYND